MAPPSSSPSPSPPDEGPPRPLRWSPFGRASLRARLVVAFGLLTVLLACGILAAGITIFARRSQALVEARLSMDVGAVEQILVARQQVLVSVTRSMAHVMDPDLRDQLLCACLGSGQSVFDLVLSLSGGQVAYLDPIGCRAIQLPEDVAARLRASDVGDLARLAREAGALRAGWAILPADGIPDRAGAILTIAAASPLPGDGVVVLFGVLSERNDVAREIADSITRRQGTPYRVSLFRDDVRVASSLGAEAIGSHADPAVAERVLDQGEMRVGDARVLDRTIPAAYVPLRRVDSSVAGMLGLATTDDLYGTIRTRTVNQFVLVGIGALLLALASAWILSVSFVRPIRALAEGMTHVARGDLDYKVAVHSQDELGSLARAFNRMVRAVKERDIRLQTMTAEKLSLVEKQVSVGRLAAGVAHEINNPLTAILTLSMLVRRKLPQDDPRRADLDIVCDEATRCRDIVQSLLDFARERPTRMDVVDVGEVVEETCAFVERYGAFAGMNLVASVTEEPFLVRGDAKQLQQVVTNLLLNAAEASAPGDTVRIAVEEDSSGGFVHVVVEDHGRGIPADALQRIFEPFFTTKEGGTGTGLGLSVSLGIVQRHEGTIQIESEPGRGTRATVVLPRLEDGTSGP